MTQVHNHDLDPTCRETETREGLKGACMLNGGAVRQTFDFKPGDIVRLTGEGWKKYDFQNHLVEVIGRDDVGPKIKAKHDDGQHYRIVNNGQFGDFSAELVEAAPLAPRKLTLDELNEVAKNVKRTDDELDRLWFQEQVSDVLEGIRELLYKKNESYGNSALEPLRVFSRVDRTEQLKVRIDDKLNRLYSGNEYEQEDTVTDLIRYLVLLKIAEREENDDS